MLRWNASRAELWGQSCPRWCQVPVNLYHGELEGQVALRRATPGEIGGVPFVAVTTAGYVRGASSDGGRTHKWSRSEEVVTVLQGPDPHGEFTERASWKGGEQAEAAKEWQALLLPPSSDDVDRTTCSGTPPGFEPPRRLCGASCTVIQPRQLIGDRGYRLVDLGTCRVGPSVGDFVEQQVELVATDPITAIVGGQTVRLMRWDGASTTLALSMAAPGVREDPGAAIDAAIYPCDFFAAEAEATIKIGYKRCQRRIEECSSTALGHCAWSERYFRWVSYAVEAVMPRSPARESAKAP